MNKKKERVVTFRIWTKSGLGLRPEPRNDTYATLRQARAFGRLLYPMSKLKIEKVTTITEWF